MVSSLYVSEHYMMLLAWSNLVCHYCLTRRWRKSVHIMMAYTWLHLQFHSRLFHTSLLLLMYVLTQSALLMQTIQGCFCQAQWDFEWECLEANVFGQLVKMCFTVCNGSPLSHWALSQRNIEAPKCPTLDLRQLSVAQCLRDFNILVQPWCLHIISTGFHLWFWLR